jgi:hypothetical protein
MFKHWIPEIQGVVGIEDEETFCKLIADKLDSADAVSSFRNDCRKDNECAQIGTIALNAIFQVAKENYKRIVNRLGSKESAKDVLSQKEQSA